MNLYLEIKSELLFKSISLKFINSESSKLNKNPLIKLKVLPIGTLLFNIKIEEEGDEFVINSSTDNQLNYAIKLFNS